MSDLATFDKSETFKRILASFDGGHDPIQLEYFVVGQGLTPYGQWRQACLEATVRYQECKRITFERLKTEAEIKILKADCNEMRNPEHSPRIKAKAELKEIEIQEKYSRLEDLDHALSTKLRELEIVAALAEKFGQACNWKDTPENQMAYHEERLKRMADVRINYPEASGVAETAMLLPARHADVVMQSIDNSRALRGSSLQLTEGE
jgi:hypothetical protein